MSDAASPAAVADLRPVAPPARRRVSFRAVFGIAVLLLMGGAALAAPQIAPWDPGRQMLVKRLRPPRGRSGASASIRSAPTTSDATS